MFPTSTGLMPYLGAWVATLAGVWFLFEKTDDTVSPQIRRRVSEWLQDTYYVRHWGQWPLAFAASFDRVFGERHLSFRCFGKSAVASVCAVWITTLFWLVLNPPSAFLPVAYLYLAVTFGGLLVNVLPDYLSLLETRYVLRGMTSRRRTYAFLVGDALFTAAIALAVWIGFFGIVGGVTLQELGRLLYWIVTMSEHAYVHVPGYQLPLGVYFYSTFFTSVWLWVFAAAGASLRLGQRAIASLPLLSKVADVQEKPFRSLGLAALVVVTLAYAIGLPFLLLIGAV